jgi:hypothetical protein
VPLTEHDDEKTTWLTPTPSSVSTSFAVPATLFSQ